MTRIDTGHPPYTKGAKPVGKADPFRDLEYLRIVKEMNCIVCGAAGPSDAHHCTHRPDADGPNPYDREPCGARKSGDRDAIPLCKRHHQNGPEAIHNGKETWRRKHGPDYGFILVIRARVAVIRGEIDF